MSPLSHWLTCRPVKSSDLSEQSEGSTAYGSSTATRSVLNDSTVFTKARVAFFKNHPAEHPRYCSGRTTKPCFTGFPIT